MAAKCRYEDVFAYDFSCHCYIASKKLNRLFWFSSFSLRSTSAHAARRLFNLASRYSRSIWSILFHLVDDAFVFEPCLEVSDARFAEYLSVSEWCSAVLTMLFRVPHLFHLHVCEVVDDILGVAVCECFVVCFDAWVLMEDKVVESGVCVYWVGVEFYVLDDSLIFDD